MLDLKQFDRKAFSVKAVRVTDDNLAEVAEWCSGEIQNKLTIVDGVQKTETYIKVRVHRPLNEKQTQAFVGDWILFSSSGFKVYTNRAFVSSFQEAEEELVYTEADSLEQRYGTSQPPGNVFNNDLTSEVPNGRELDQEVQANK